MISMLIEECSEDFKILSCNVNFDRFGLFWEIFYGLHKIECQSGRFRFACVFLETALKVLRHTFCNG